MARSSGASQAMLVQEAAAGLGAFIGDPGALVMACRRVVAGQPASGPLVWLAAHLLASHEPHVTIGECLDQVRTDRTAARLAHWIPADATVCVLGWPDVAVQAISQRTDLRVLTVDPNGGVEALSQLVAEAETDSDDIPLGGLAGAVSSSDVLLVEASAVGPDGACAVAGSLAAAAVASSDSAVECVLVAGVGRMLPKRMFDGVKRRLEKSQVPWFGDDEFVSLDHFDWVACDGGVVTADDSVDPSGCPVVGELFGSNDGIAI